MQDVSLRDSKETLKKLDRIFSLSVISVSSVVFQQFNSTTEDAEIAEWIF
jgi:hypothetical protein